MGMRKEGWKGKGEVKGMIGPQFCFGKKAVDRLRFRVMDLVCVCFPDHRFVLFD